MSPGSQRVVLWRLWRWSVEEGDDVRHGDCCWGCCWTKCHRLHGTDQRTTVDLVKWTGYARCDGWTPVFVVDRWDWQSPTTQTSRTSAYRCWLPGRHIGWLIHPSQMHAELSKRTVSGHTTWSHYAHVPPLTSC